MGRIRDILKKSQSWFHRRKYREGRTLSRFIARDVRRDILIVSAARIDEGIIIGRVRTTNALYVSKDLMPQPEFEAARELNIKEMWNWTGEPWGGLADGTSIADHLDLTSLGLQQPTEDKPAKEPKQRSGCIYGVVGAGIGGCLLPVVLFLFAGVALRDTGGPLFWPLIGIPLALTGLALGLWFHAEFRSKN